MPTISQFYGVTIRMYYEEHPPPHFHAYYGEYAAVIDLRSLHVREGRLPRRALALVRQWARAHRQALEDNWQALEAHRPLRGIEPLE